MSCASEHVARRIVTPWIIANDLSSATWPRGTRGWQPSHAIAGFAAAHVRRSLVEFLESICKYNVEAAVITRASAIVGISSQVNPQCLAGAWEATVSVCVRPRGTRA